MADRQLTLTPAVSGARTPGFAAPAAAGFLGVPATEPGALAAGAASADGAGETTPLPVCSGDALPLPSGASAPSACSSSSCAAAPSCEPSSEAGAPSASVRTGEATPSELASSAAGGEDMWVVRWGAGWWEKVREARRGGGERATQGAADRERRHARKNEGERTASDPADCSHIAAASHHTMARRISCAAAGRMQSCGSMALSRSGRGSFRPWKAARAFCCSLAAAARHGACARGAHWRRAWSPLAREVGHKQHPRPSPASLCIRRAQRR